MDSLETRALPETAGASNPFFSPDGMWIGFFADRMLKKISVEGGAPVALAPAHDSRGGCWSEGDEIVFAADAGSGLVRIPAGGGSPRPLTELDVSRGELSHRWPSLVAGADAVLFTLKTKGLQTFDDAPIAAVSLKSGERRNVIDGGTGPSYSSTGHLVYARAGALLAAPFDPVRLAVTGPPFTALDGVSHSRGTGSAHYALSRTGTLLSLPGSVDVDNRMLVRSDLQGGMETLARETRPFIMVRTSPDGRRLALWIGTADDEVWTYEIERGILARLVQGATNPVWSPDGEWILFSGAVEDDLGRVRADGSGAPEPLLTRKRSQVPSSISPDGRLLAFTEDTPETGSDVWTLSLDRRETHLVLGDSLQRKRGDVLPRRAPSRLCLRRDGPQRGLRPALPGSGGATPGVRGRRNEPRVGPAARRDLLSGWHRDDDCDRANGGEPPVVTAPQSLRRRPPPDLR